MLTCANTLANAQYSSCVQRSVGCLWHWAHSSRTPRNAAATFSPHCSTGTFACRRQKRPRVFLFTYSVLKPAVGGAPLVVGWVTSICVSILLTNSSHSLGAQSSRLVARRMSATSWAYGWLSAMRARSQSSHIWLRRDLWFCGCSSASVLFPVTSLSFVAHSAACRGCASNSSIFLA